MFGAGTGLLSTLAPGIISSALIGGSISAINNIYNQKFINPCGELDWYEITITSFASGAFIGFMGGTGSKIGRNIISGKFNSIYPSPIKAYGTEGGLIGNLGGTLITKYR